MIEPVTINVRLLTRDFGLPQEQVEKVVALLDEGFLPSFIAKYRKDQVENLDEERIVAIDTELKALRTLCERKQAILKTLDSSGKLTPELDKNIRDSKTLRRLEEIYHPYKPKKQGLAQTARERGLEPLAEEISSGKLTQETLDNRASEFIDEDKKVNSIADALLGAGHLIAEQFGERTDILHRIWDLLYQQAKITTTKLEIQTPVVQAPSKKTKKEKSSGQTIEIETKNQSSPVAKHDAIESDDVSASVSIENVEKTEESDSSTLTTVVAVEEPADAIMESSNQEEDSSGSGGGDENVGEPSASEVSESENASQKNESSNDISETVSIDTTRTDTEVEELTEQFQQIKEAMQEKGAPTVISQNTIRKKKRAEAKKRKAEAKNRQHEHLEKQFAEYFNFSSGIRNIPPQRIQAINRGERAKVLKVALEYDRANIFETVKEICVPQDHPLADFLSGCLKDSLDRIIMPAMEREIRSELAELSDQYSIRVFSRNLRNLLLQPPLRRKRVLALLSDVRKSCKMVALDEYGNSLEHDTVFLFGGAERKEKAGQKIADFVQKNKINIIAIGSSTGVRDAEECVSKMIAKHFTETDLSYIVVNDVGAHAYSTSQVGKEEFPTYDPALRAAISIGRHLQDPLVELVKVDPFNLAIGLHQHDVRGKMLNSVLAEIVALCVNYVGVDLNAALPSQLRYVSGLNQLTAKRIYDYRRGNGPFRCREDLKKIPGMNDAVYTQAIGFLKIVGGSNPLDATWIHPESYDLAIKILDKLGFTVDDLKDVEKVKQIAAKIREGRVSVLSTQFAEDFGAGVATVRLILDNLSWLGRDPRDLLPKPIFRKGMIRIEDLSPGAELTGTVLNVVEFGAFIDIGLPESGLVHISHMADRFIKDAYDRVAVGDVVKVWVLEADAGRKRISLSLLPPGTERQQRKDQRRGDERRDRQEGQATENKDGSKREDKRNDHRKEGDRPPRKDGDRRGGPNRDGRGRDNRERNRGPKSFVTTPKEKSIKPISEDMKKGKEPLRSFGDLAQLLGRVQISDSDEKKKRQKEEERRRREKEQKERPGNSSGEIVQNDSPTAEATENKTENEA